MAITKDDFKQAMGHFASGVTVVSFKNGDRFSGLTASSFTSLSMDPFLILFNLNKNSSSLVLIEEAKAFCINILSSGQESLSNDFAFGDKDRDALVLENGYEIAETGSPLLKGALSHIDCALEKIYDGGDHAILIGRVLYAKTDESKRPLLYFNRKYYSI